MPHVITETVREVVTLHGRQIELTDHHSTWVEEDWYTRKATSSERKTVDDYVSMLEPALRYVKTLPEINRMILELIPLYEVNSNLRVVIMQQYYKKHIYPYCKD